MKIDQSVFSKKRLSTFLLFPLSVKLILNKYIAVLSPWNLSTSSQSLGSAASVLTSSSTCYLKNLIRDLEMWLQESSFGGII